MQLRIVHSLWHLPVVASALSSIRTWYFEDKFVQAEDLLGQRCGQMRNLDPHYLHMIPINGYEVRHYEFGYYYAETVFQLSYIDIL